MPKQLKQKIITLVGGVVIIAATAYAYQITSLQIEALNEGVLVKSKIFKITSKRAIRTIYVTINGQTYHAGKSFGPYDSSKVGDIVFVRHKPGIKYVVLEGRGDFRNVLIFEYIAFTVGTIDITRYFL